MGDWTSEGLIAQELYDHTGDVGYGAETFDDYEYVNLAYKPANATRVQELALVLANQFQHDWAYLRLKLHKLQKKTTMLFLSVDFCPRTLFLSI